MEESQKSVNFVNNGPSSQCSQPEKPPGWGKRHTLAIMGFWGFAFSYAMRFNLSLAIVAMVKYNNTNIVNSSYHVVNEKVTSSSYLSQNDDGEFSWTEAEQGLILGSFFWGYVVTQLPGGILSNKYGGKWPLGLGILLTAIFAILTPICARTHVALLIAARIVQGFGEGLCTPAMHALLANWAPPNERGLIASIAYSGTSFGAAATMVLSGYLIEAGFFGGWPSVFYVIGIAAIVWFVIWCVLVFDVPDSHPRISPEELGYIKATIGQQRSEVKAATPWKSIWLSGPLWVILLTHTGHTWGLYTLCTEMPTFMKSVLNLDIGANSWMSALPYAVMCVTALVIPFMADVAIHRKWVSTLTVRKTCQVIAHGIGALAMIAVSYCGNGPAMIFLLTMAVGCSGAVFAGFGINHVDIAANYAGVLMGITNTIANASGIVAPYIAGLLINGNPSMERWRIVFYIAAIIMLVDTVIYLMFASTTEQSWNRPGNEANTTDEVNDNGQVRCQSNRIHRSESSDRLITEDSEEPWGCP